MKRDPLPEPEFSSHTGSGWFWSAVGGTLNKELGEPHLFGSLNLIQLLILKLNFCTVLEKTIKEQIENLD